MEIKKYHINNLDIHHIYTNKFKTLISGIVFRTDLKKEFLVEKMILSFMVERPIAWFNVDNLIAKINPHLSWSRF